MNYFDEAEKVFLDTVYQKKKETASLRAAQKHKRLGKASMKFPSDFMNRKEKMKHMKAGKVMTTNLFDNILTLAEFIDLEEHEKRNRMQYWRSKYTIKEIFSGMGIAQSTFYKIIDELGLPKDRSSAKPRKPREGRKTVAVITKKETVEAATPEIITAPPAPPAPPVQEIILNGLNVTFNGTYKAEAIQKQLLKILTLLDEEDDQFYVEFKLMQKTK